MNTENVKRFLKRVVVMVLALTSFTAVINMMASPDVLGYRWLIIGIYALWALAGIVWMCSPFFRRNKKRSNDTVRKISLMTLSVTLAHIFLMLPTTAIAQETKTVGHVSPSGLENDNTVVVEEESSGAYRIISLKGAYVKKLTEDELSALVEGALLRKRGSGGDYTTSAITLAGVLIVIVVIAVVVGTVYVGYKLYKAISRIGERKRREIEREESGQGNGANSSNSATFAALFFAGPAPLLDEDSVAESKPPFSIRYTVPESGGVAQITSAYFPEETVPLESFLTAHALSTNLFEDSFSVDGISTPSSPVLTRAGDTVRVTLSEKINVTSVFQRSADLIEWETLGKLSAPVGARVTFGDSTSTHTGEKLFYRVVIE